MKLTWERVHHIEWLLRPTPDAIVYVRRLEGRANWAWRISRHNQHGDSVENVHGRAGSWREATKRARGMYLELRGEWEKRAVSASPGG